MTTQVTYFASECDCCKRTFGMSGRTIERHEAMLRSENWAVFNGRLCCPSCLKIAFTALGIDAAMAAGRESANSKD